MNGEWTMDREWTMDKEWTMNRELLTHQGVDEDFNMLRISLCTEYQGNISSRFSNYSEAHRDIPYLTLTGN